MKLQPAVIEVVRSDPAGAWTRFAAERAAVFATTASHTQLETIATILHMGHNGETASDPRWLETAAQLRKHRQLGWAARYALESVPTEELADFVARFPLERPVAGPQAIPASRDWLARYERGEYAVWNEILAHADAIAQHPELRPEAYAVAVALMARVRQNTAALRATLLELGAQLGDQAGPPDDAEIEPITTALGPLPLAIEAFYRVVGSIDLRSYPSELDEAPSLIVEGIELLELDPLSVEAFDFFQVLLDEYEEIRAWVHPELVGPYTFDFQPLHADDIGGTPHAFDLPPETARDAIDPQVGYVTFVEVLRRAFRFGGIPMLADAPAEPAARVIALLRANVVEF